MKVKNTASSVFNSTCRLMVAAAPMLLVLVMSPASASETEQGAASKEHISAEEKQRVGKMLQEQIIRCWSPPPGASESGVQATIFMELNPDGTLKSEPRVETVKHPGSPFANMIAKSAIRAVKMCGKEHPFKLPAEAYDFWAVSHITFDPKTP